MRGCALVMLAVGLVAGLLGVGVAVFGGLNANGGPLAVVVGAGIAAVGIGLLVGAVVLLRRTRPHADTGTAARAGAPTPAYPADRVVHGELAGAAYTTYYQTPTTGKHARPSELRVGTAVDTPCEVRVTTETWFDRACKRVGLATEIETGDDAFDAECYVRSDTPAFADAYLADPLKRAAVLDLRRMGFADVTLENRTVTAKWVGFDPPRHDRPDLVVEVAARLLVLARGLPEPHPDFDYRTGRHRRKWQVGLWSFLVGFAATTLTLLAYPPISWGELLLRAVAVLAVGGPSFAYVSALALRGTSTSHYAWGGLMAGALLLFPVGSVGLVALVNGAADSSPEVTHDAVIVEKYTSKSKNRTKYHVRAASWRVPGETHSFDVSQADYNAVTAHQSQIRVTTRTGALGVEWLVRKQVVAKPR